MKEQFSRFLLAGLILTFCFSACAVKNQVLPLNNRVLAYDLPFDLTFLRVYEAIDRLPEWTTHSTEKQKGIIKARNINYRGLDDSENRLLTILVSHDGRNKTTVQIAPGSQHVLGGDVILSSIEKTLDREF